MDAARAAVVSFCIAAISYCAAANGHETRSPKRDELRVSPSEMIVTIEYQVPRGDLARALRAIFDRDKSGALDEEETARLGRHLAREATAFLALAVDGKPAALAVGEPVVDARGPADEAIAIVVRATARVALAGGAHALRFADHHKDRRFPVPVRLLWEAGAVPKKAPREPFVDEKHALDLSFAIK